MRSQSQGHGADSKFCQTKSEDGDEDVPVSGDAQPTQVDDAVNGIVGEDFDMTMGDPPEEVEPATVRRPTGRILVSIQDTFSPSPVVHAEVSEQAPASSFGPLGGEEQSDRGREGSTKFRG